MINPILTVSTLTVVRREREDLDRLLGNDTTQSLGMMVSVMVSMMVSVMVSLMVSVVMVSVMVSVMVGKYL